MAFHKDSQGKYLPLLPRGDPAVPRKKPRFSVIDRPKDESMPKRKVQVKDGDEDDEGKRSKAHRSPSFPVGPWSSCYRLLDACTLMLS